MVLKFSRHHVRFFQRHCRCSHNQTMSLNLMPPPFVYVLTSPPLPPQIFRLYRHLQSPQRLARGPSHRLPAATQLRPSPRSLPPHGTRAGRGGTDAVSAGPAELGTLGEAAAGSLCGGVQSARQTAVCARETGTALAETSPGFCRLSRDAGAGPLPGGVSGV